MIIAAVIVAYVLVGIATARWTAVRRRARDLWHDADEDDYIACALALSLWPVASLMYLVTAPTRDERRIRKAAQIKELEEELGLR